MDKAITSSTPIKEDKTISKVKKISKKYGLYMANIITRNVLLPFISVGSNIKDNLQKKLVEKLEGKCVLEGYIKPNSVRVITYSAGELITSNVSFNVVIDCLICNPPEGMKMKVRATNITKAGIRAVALEKNSPIDVFIARDHHFVNKVFTTVKEGDTITIKVIGQRYEINDPSISILAELVRDRVKKLPNVKPKLVFIEE